MRTVSLRIRIPTADAPVALARIADFARFPALADDVRSVHVHPVPAPGLPRNTDWEVNFRRGVMRWNEWEHIRADRLRIEFGQIDGDFAEFHGFWWIEPAAAGCDVHFGVTYDFGIESLAGLMDPIAERVIKRVITSVLSELFGAIEVLEGGEALVDLRQG
jgi:polyketide cyclase/dehydrase/lipid transport protein